MNAHGRLVQPHDLTHLAGRAIAVMTQHEDRSLPTVEPIDRPIELGPALAGEQPRLGVEIHRAPKSPARTVDAARVLGRRKPAVASKAGFASIDTAVDDESREPHLERPRLAIRSDMGEYLDECILNGLVRLGRVPQVLIGDSESAPLVRRDEPAEALARLLGAPALHE